MTIQEQYNHWKETILKKSLDKFKERKARFETSSGIEVPRVPMPVDDGASTSPAAPLRADTALFTTSLAFSLVSHK